MSETSRQLYVHRNTLVYRLEKLEKSTGLDIRKFDDALTFKIAMMVVSYMTYMNNSENLYNRSEPYRIAGVQSTEQSGYRRGQKTF